MRATRLPVGELTATRTRGHCQGPYGPTWQPLTDSQPWCQRHRHSEQAPQCHRGICPQLGRVGKIRPGPCLLILDRNFRPAGILAGPPTLRALQRLRGTRPEVPQTVRHPPSNEPYIAEAGCTDNADELAHLTKW